MSTAFGWLSCFTRVSTPTSCCIVSLQRCWHQRPFIFCRRHPMLPLHPSMATQCTSQNATCCSHLPNNTNTSPYLIVVCWFYSAVCSKKEYFK
jgi:hypothetical protein